MLCQFTFRNFKSYKNETILDLQAVNGQNFQDALLSSPNDKNEFLPVSVIYGPNAGGKSNVLSALNSVISLVMKPVLMFENKLIQYETVELTPFLFDETSSKEPTDFEIYFRPNNDYEYKYSISITNGKIEEENLDSNITWQKQGSIFPFCISITSLNLLFLQSAGFKAVLSATMRILLQNGILSSAAVKNSKRN